MLIARVLIEKRGSAHLVDPDDDDVDDDETSQEQRSEIPNGSFESDGVHYTGDNGTSAVRMWKRKTTRNRSMMTKKVNR